MDPILYSNIFLFGCESSTPLWINKRTPALPFHSHPDILDEICEYIQDRQNLLWVALTCRAFLEPPLDCLWRSLESLFLLLKILPSLIQGDGTYVSV